MRKRVILALAAVLPLTGAAAVTGATQAAADPTKSRVVVQGTVEDCEDDTPPLQVTIETKNNEKVVDSSPRVEDDSKYKVTLKTVPKNGVKATATVECEEDEYKKSFTVKRPPGTKLIQTFNITP
ncbi:hypothetical protein SGFS_069850 [Streptomyces graminofaciens]|jgi:hypothetical protein|uniref:Uncharacterized protein n=1 Tax=Streptomyces graminofaciens TaxID=68212 RepID=A0ABN5VR89_9ACTN|nr:hypothetical protein [Streptomyces graminofaciens]BBC35691.1 hypothetical protein SGFS_069850 [Streptomyces graminofaciens]